MTSAPWQVLIDWNNDSDFADSGEDVTSRVLNSPGIVCVRGRDQIRALAPPMAGSCEFALDNASKDYSPDYASSPLYGNLVPGRAVRLLGDPATAVWAGHLDDLPQEPFARGGGRVRVPALGKLAKLKGVAIWEELHTDIAMNDAITYVFVRAGLAASEYTLLDTGKTTLSAWWCAGDDAFGMLMRLLAAEGPGAAIYEQGDGKIAFHSRHYRLLTTRSNTSQVTFGNAATEPKHSPPFGYEPNLKGVVNTASIATKALSLATGAVTTLATATFNPPLQVPALASVAITFTLSAPARDWSTDITDTHFPYSESFDVVAGQRVTATITSAAAYTGTIATIELHGHAYTSVDGPSVEHTVDTSASVAKYGARTPPSSFSPWPYLSQGQAQDLCNSVVVAYQEPRPTVAVTVKNANSTRLAQQLAREVSDRVTVVESQTGINADVYIERIRHEVREGGRFHATTFGCEKAGAYDNYFVFDADNFDGESFGF